jgi:multimeric flavodoxin WrbA
MPGDISQQLEKMVNAALKDKNYIVIKNPQEMPDLRNKKLLFAIELNSIGINIPLMEMMSELTKRGQDSLLGCTAALLIHSNSDLYSKSTAANIIFSANQLGCSFIGHPLVEALGNLKNLRTWQKTLELSLEEISLKLSHKLATRLIEFKPIKYRDPKLAYLHSSFRKTSNTLMLWQMVEWELNNYHIEELYIENGSVFDCFGCSYKACLEYGKNRNCRYGGLMTEKIIPVIEASDVLIWICPNYNDSISSNLMAVINRLTTLYRQISFNNKMIFAIIVSGNSGSDSIAKQLIDALNINKGFILPPYFCLIETSNDVGSILKVANIKEKAGLFAKNINNIISN